MKVAVTEWHGRVAPLFDVAGTVLLVADDGTRETARLQTPFDSPHGRIDFLEQHGINVLICGAISPSLRQQAEAHGILVHAFVSGEIRDVLEALTANRLDEPGFSMPGCRRCRRRHGHNHQN